MTQTVWCVPIDKDAAVRVTEYSGRPPEMVEAFKVSVLTAMLRTTSADGAAA